jgi:hypothetical protein
MGHTNRQPMPFNAIYVEQKNEFKSIGDIVSERD